jgi:carboxyl-terminal processing protease
MVRSTKLWFILALLLAAGARPAGSFGQNAPAGVVADDVAIVLERGALLEQQRRWAEALTHYEEAVRHHPDRRDLVDRLQSARMHYDVCRRYADATFTASVSSLSERDALAIYDEVLVKIHSHYVQEPDWQEMFRRGTSHLSVALSEPPFVNKHLARLKPEQLTSLRQYVPQVTRELKVADRHEAVEAAGRVAQALSKYFGFPPQAAIMEYVCGAAHALDDYSSFLTGSQMDEVFAQIEGNFVGLGVELRSEESALLVVNVIAGGPAAEGGIRPGERIVAVDGRTTRDMGITADAMADLLRGQEGTRVQVDVRASDGNQRRLTLTRRRVEVPSVDQVKMIDAERGIGYFRIASFQKTTPRDVEDALWKLHGQGLRSLVIDVRGNPGGLLKAAVDVADKFVMDGMIVATRGRSPREDFDHRGQVAGTWRVPLVVLIDHDSASASEIFAGAIQDHRRGTIVGQRSYGKGSVQGIFPLSTGNGGVRLTTARWYTPSGQPISGRGVSPDVTVRVAAKPTADAAGAPAATNSSLSQDPFLEAALNVARSHLSQQP